MKTYGRVRTDDASAAAPAHGFHLDPDTGIWRPGANRLGFATDGTARWEIDATGHWVPAADNTHDVGATAAAIRDLYIDGQIKGGGPITTPATFGATSSWTATTTNPTNRLWTAHYTQIGQRVFAEIQLTANAGFTAGSGSYVILTHGTIDTTVYPPNMPIGAWQASIGGVLTGGNVRRQGTNSVRCTISAGGTFGSGEAMTAGDTLFLQLNYLVT